MSDKDDKRKNLKRLAVGTGVAAAAGYVAGLLTAPKSGRETRRDIKNAANQRMAQAEKELKKLHTELDKLIKEANAKRTKLSQKAQTELTKVVTKSQDTKEKVREVLSAIHEGDANDKDLQKAVKEARAAAKHLKSYLKK